MPPGKRTPEDAGLSSSEVLSDQTQSNVQMSMQQILADLLDLPTEVSIADEYFR